MMGSGKTTVGKIMARALGYTLFDSDTLIEQAMNGTSVAEIFEHIGESVFREKENSNCSDIALKLGYKSVPDLTPTEIAIEAFEQVQSYLDNIARPDGL